MFRQKIAITGSTPRGREVAFYCFFSYFMTIPQPGLILYNRKEWNHEILLIYCCFWPLFLSLYAECLGKKGNNY